MNKQEIFNTVVTHLRQQNCRSVSASGVCLYRGPNGTKCAAGVLIPDELFREGYNNLRFDYLIRYKPEIRDLFDDAECLRLILDLQTVHDISTPEIWEDKFQGLSLKYDVEMPVK